MSSVNKVILIGNVGSEPEIRSMNNGKEVASFSVATSEKWKDKTSGERRERTEWHRIVVFNEGLVKIIRNYITKGSKLYIEGALQTRKYEKDGVEKYTTEVVLQGFNSSITMLGSKDDNNQTEHNQAKADGFQPKKEENTETQELDDDIPFN